MSDDDVLSGIAGRLTGRTAVVTGAGDAGDDSIGVGAAISVALAAAGASVVVFDRDAAAADRTLGRVSAIGGTAAPAIGDVTSMADCTAAAVTAAAARDGRIDIVVNNAATLGGATSLDFDDDEVIRTLDINLVGAMRMAKACSPYLDRGSSIVNITSLGALRTFGRLDYEASKGALATLTSSLAVQLGSRGVRVNAVCPGQVWTPLGKRRLVEMGRSDAQIAEARRARALGNPLREEGTGWDIALATVFLASSEARWITGQMLVVDGGQSAVVGWMPGSTPTG